MLRAGSSTSAVLLVVMGFRFFHTLLWLGGLFYGVVPFIWRHEFAGSGEVITWGDYMGSGALLFMGLAAMGSFLWGVLARFIKVDVEGQRQLKRWFWLALTVQSIVSIMGIYGVVSGYMYYFTGSVAVVLVAWFVYLGYGVSSELWPQVKSFCHWLVRKNSWNGVFYGVIFLFLLWHNYLAVFDIKPLDWGFHSSLMLNRVFNQVAIVGALYLVIQFSIVAAPKWSRFLVWGISSLIPLGILADSLMMGMWNTSLVDMANSWGLEGLQNIETEMNGAGIGGVSVMSMVLSALGGLLVLCGLVYLMYWISGKLKMRVSPLTVVICVVVAVLGATLEQHFGKTWKPMRFMMAEESGFDVQLGISAKLPPLVEFDVVFKDHHLNVEELGDTVKKPDVFVLLVETFREDSLTEEITPYMHAFKEHEAQPIERSWAASNGTHLSWFGIFSGRVPVHRENDSDRCAGEGWPGLNVFQAWKNRGYGLHMYAASTLDYRSMGNHFVGSEGKLFDLVRQDAEGDEIHEIELPERERMLLDSFKQDLKERKAGGESPELTYFCLDSPHFYYQWHKDFDPPFKPYHERTYFPSRPNEEELQLVKNKYYNALAWADTLVEEFCEELKKQGVYDDSIVVIVGDHGEELQDNGGWLHVSSLENEQIRVPMLVKWPKAMGRGPALADASQLDLMPSLLECAFGQEVTSLAGVSLLNGEERSAISTTDQGGQLEDAMVFSKNGYKAYFKWAGYFNGRPTNKITLSRLTGPDGEIRGEDAAFYEGVIMEHFGDAVERSFVTFERVVEEDKSEDEE